MSLFLAISFQSSKAKAQKCTRPQPLHTLGAVPSVGPLMRREWILTLELNGMVRRSCSSQSLSR